MFYIGDFRRNEDTAERCRAAIRSRFSKEDAEVLVDANIIETARNATTATVYGFARPGSVKSPTAASRYL
jgi:hypothetical protein